MKEIKLQYESLNKDRLTNLIALNEENVIKAKDSLINKDGQGNDFTGWVDYPTKITEYDLDVINETADKMKTYGDYLVVIGIGGSYLGARAIIDLLDGYYQKSKIIFLGNNISSEYIGETLNYLESVDFCVNVVSKSGKTLEPAIAFRLVKELLKSKYGAKYNERIFVTTSKNDSLLHEEAQANGYQEFFIPSDIGGRYSVFTAVGLLPLAFAGYNILEFVHGAINSYIECSTLPYFENDALIYASLRNILYNENKTIEALVTYEPKAKNFGEWWKQLFGESEGKNHKGIFPVSLVYSTDLHSLGQYVQDGIRNIFETVIETTEVSQKKAYFDKDPVINYSSQNIDGLNYLSDKRISYIKKQTTEGVIKAHISGNVPNIKLSIKEINEYYIGYLLYFFMFSCGVSGYILDVNPFNQEGVEEYKKNMMALLRK